MPGPKWRASNGRTYTHPHRPDTFDGMTTMLRNGVPSFLDNWYKKFTAEWAVDHVDEWRNLPRNAAVDIVKRATDRYRDSRGDTGTIVHEWAEDLMAGRKPTTALVDDERALALLPAVRKWVEDFRPRPVACEITAYNVELGYAGTADFLGYLDAAPELGLCIVDYKTGAHVGLKEALQQVGYAECDHYLDENDAEVPMPRVDTLLLMQPHESGDYTLHRVRYDDDMRALLRAVRLVSRCVTAGNKWAIPGTYAKTPEVEPTGVLATSAECGSCGAAIYFAHAQSGRAVMPLDVEPVADGNITLDDDGRYRVLGKGDAAAEGAPRYVSHFATCADAAKHRKAKRKRATKDENPPAEAADTRDAAQASKDAASAAESAEDVFDGLERVDTADAVANAKSARVKAAIERGKAKAREVMSVDETADKIKDTFPGTVAETDNGEFAEAQVDAAELRANLIERIAAMPPAAVKRLKAFWPAGIGTFKAQPEHTLAELHAIREVIIGVEREHELPFHPEPRAPQPPRESFTPKPTAAQPTLDTADEAAHDAVIDVLKSLPENVLNAVSVFVKGQGVPNLRSYQATVDQLDLVMRTVTDTYLREEVGLADDEIRAFADFIYPKVGIDDSDLPTLGQRIAIYKACRLIGETYQLVTGEDGSPIWSVRDVNAG